MELLNATAKKTEIIDNIIDEISVNRQQRVQGRLNEGKQQHLPYSGDEGTTYNSVYDLEKLIDNKIYDMMHVSNPSMPVVWADVLMRKCLNQGKAPISSPNSVLMILYQYYSEKKHESFHRLRLNYLASKHSLVTGSLVTSRKYLFSQSRLYNKMVQNRLNESKIRQVFNESDLSFPSLSVSKSRMVIPLESEMPQNLNIRASTDVDKVYNWIGHPFFSVEDVIRVIGRIVKHGKQREVINKLSSELHWISIEQRSSILRSVVLKSMYDTEMRSSHNTGRITRKKILKRTNTSLENNVTTATRSPLRLNTLSDAKGGSRQGSIDKNSSGGSKTQLTQNDVSFREVEDTYIPVFTNHPDTLKQRFKKVLKHIQHDVPPEFVDYAMANSGYNTDINIKVQAGFFVQLSRFEALVSATVIDLKCLLEEIEEKLSSGSSGYPADGAADSSTVGTGAAKDINIATPEETFQGVYIKNRHSGDAIEMGEFYMKENIVSRRKLECYSSLSNDDKGSTGPSTMSIPMNTDNPPRIIVSLPAKRSLKLFLHKYKGMAEHPVFLNNKYINTSYKRDRLSGTAKMLGSRGQGVGQMKPSPQLGSMFGGSSFQGSKNNPLLSQRQGTGAMQVSSQGSYDYNEVPNAIDVFRSMELFDIYNSASQLTRFNQFNNPIDRLNITASDVYAIKDAFGRNACYFYENYTASTGAGKGVASKPNTETDDNQSEEGKPRRGIKTKASFDPTLQTEIGLLDMFTPSSGEIVVAYALQQSHNKDGKSNSSGLALGTPSSHKARMISDGGDSRTAGSRNGTSPSKRHNRSQSGRKLFGDGTTGGQTNNRSPTKGATNPREAEGSNVGNNNSEESNEVAPSIKNVLQSYFKTRATNQNDAQYFCNSGAGGQTSGEDNRTNDPDPDTADDYKTGKLTAQEELENSTLINTYGLACYTSTLSFRLQLLHSINGVYADINNVLVDLYSVRNRMTCFNEAAELHNSTFSQFSQFPQDDKVYIPSCNNPNGSVASKISKLSNNAGTRTDQESCLLNEHDQDSLRLYFVDKEINGVEHVLLNNSMLLNDVIGTDNDPLGGVASLNSMMNVGSCNTSVAGTAANTTQINNNVSVSGTEGKDKLKHLREYFTPLQSIEKDSLNRYKVLAEDGDKESEMEIANGSGNIRVSYSQNKRAEQEGVLVFQKQQRQRIETKGKHKTDQIAMASSRGGNNTSVRHTVSSGSNVSTSPQSVHGSKLASMTTGSGLYNIETIADGSGEEVSTNPAKDKGSGINIDDANEYEESSDDGFKALFKTNKKVGGAQGSQRRGNTQLSDGASNTLKGEKSMLDKFCHLFNSDYSSVLFNESFDKLHEIDDFVLRSVSKSVQAFDYLNSDVIIGAEHASDTTAETPSSKGKEQQRGGMDMSTPPTCDRPFLLHQTFKYELKLQRLKNKIIKLLLGRIYNNLIDPQSIVLLLLKVLEIFNFRPYASSVECYDMRLPLVYKDSFGLLDQLYNFLSASIETIELSCGRQTSRASNIKRTQFIPLETKFEKSPEKLGDYVYGSVLNMLDLVSSSSRDMLSINVFGTPRLMLLTQCEVLKRATEKCKNITQQLRYSNTFSGTSTLSLVVSAFKDTMKSLTKSGKTDIPPPNPEFNVRYNTNYNCMPATSNGSKDGPGTESLVRLGLGGGRSKRVGGTESSTGNINASSAMLGLGAMGSNTSLAGRGHKSVGFMDQTRRDDERHGTFEAPTYNQDFTNGLVPSPSGTRNASINQGTSLNTYKMQRMKTTRNQQSPCWGQTGQQGAGTTMTGGSQTSDGVNHRALINVENNRTVNRLRRLYLTVKVVIKEAYMRGATSSVDITTLMGKAKAGQVSGGATAGATTANTTHNINSSTITERRLGISSDLVAMANAQDQLSSVGSQRKTIGANTGGRLKPFCMKTMSTFNSINENERLMQELITSCINCISNLAGSNATDMGAYLFTSDEISSKAIWLDNVEAEDYVEDDEGGDFTGNRGMQPDSIDNRSFVPSNTGHHQIPRKFEETGKPPMPQVAKLNLDGERQKARASGKVISPFSIPLSIALNVINVLSIIADFAYANYEANKEAALLRVQARDCGGGLLKEGGSPIREDKDGDEASAVDNMIKKALKDKLKLFVGEKPSGERTTQQGGISDGVIGMSLDGDLSSVVDGDESGIEGSSLEDINHDGNTTPRHTSNSNPNSSLSSSSQPLIMNIQDVDLDLKGDSNQLSVARRARLENIISFMKGSADKKVLEDLIGLSTLSNNMRKLLLRAGFLETSYQNILLTAIVDNKSKVDTFLEAEALVMARLMSNMIDTLSSPAQNHAATCGCTAKGDLLDQVCPSDKGFLSQFIPRRHRQLIPTNYSARLPSVGTPFEHCHRPPGAFISHIQSRSTRQRSNQQHSVGSSQHSMMATLAYRNVVCSFLINYRKSEEFQLLTQARAGDVLKIMSVEGRIINTIFGIIQPSSDRTMSPSSVEAQRSASMAPKKSSRGGNIDMTGRRGDSQLKLDDTGKERGGLNRDGVTQLRLGIVSKSDEEERDKNQDRSKATESSAAQPTISLEPISNKSFALIGMEMVRLLYVQALRTQINFTQDKSGCFRSRERWDEQDLAISGSASNLIRTQGSNSNIMRSSGVGFGSSKMINFGSQQSLQQLDQHGGVWASSGSAANLLLMNSQSNANIASRGDNNTGYISNNEEGEYEHTPMLSFLETVNRGLGTLVMGVIFGRRGFLAMTYRGSTRDLGKKDGMREREGDGGRERDSHLSLSMQMSLYYLALMAVTVTSDLFSALTMLATIEDRCSISGNTRKSAIRSRSRQTKSSSRMNITNDTKSRRDLVPAVSERQISFLVSTLEPPILVSVVEISTSRLREIQHQLKILEHEIIEQWVEQKSIKVSEWDKENGKGKRRHDAEGDNGTWSRQQQSSNTTNPGQSKTAGINAVEDNERDYYDTQEQMETRNARQAQLYSLEHIRQTLVSFGLIRYKQPSQSTVPSPRGYMSGMGDGVSDAGLRRGSQLSDKNPFLVTDLDLQQLYIDVTLHQLSLLSLTRDFYLLLLITSIAAAKERALEGTKNNAESGIKCNEAVVLNTLEEMLSTAIGVNTKSNKFRNGVDRENMILLNGQPTLTPFKSFEFLKVMPRSQASQAPLSQEPRGDVVLMPGRTSALLRGTSSDPKNEAKLQHQNFGGWNFILPIIPTSAGIIERDINHYIYNRTVGGITDTPKETEKYLGPSPPLETMSEKKRVSKIIQDIRTPLGCTAEKVHLIQAIVEYKIECDLVSRARLRERTRLADEKSVAGNLMAQAHKAEQVLQAQKGERQQTGQITQPTTMLTSRNNTVPVSFKLEGGMTQRTAADNKYDTATLITLINSCFEYGAIDAVLGQSIADAGVLSFIGNASGAIAMSNFVYTTFQTLLSHKEREEQEERGRKLMKEGLGKQRDDSPYYKTSSSGRADNMNTPTSSSTGTSFVGSFESQNQLTVLSSLKVPAPSIPHLPPTNKYTEIPSATNVGYGGEDEGPDENEDQPQQQRLRVGTGNVVDPSSEPFFLPSLSGITDCYPSYGMFSRSLRCVDLWHNDRCEVGDGFILNCCRDVAIAMDIFGHPNNMYTDIVDGVSSNLCNPLSKILSKLIVLLSDRKAVLNFYQLDDPGTKNASYIAALLNGEVIDLENDILNERNAVAPINSMSFAQPRGSVAGGTNREGKTSSTGGVSDGVALGNDSQVLSQLMVRLSGSSDVAHDTEEDKSFSLSKSRTVVGLCKGVNVLKTFLALFRMRDEYYWMERITKARKHFPVPDFYKFVATMRPTTDLAAVSSQQANTITISPVSPTRQRKPNRTGIQQFAGLEVQRRTSWAKDRQKSSKAFDEQVVSLVVSNNKQIGRASNVSKHSVRKAIANICYCVMRDRLFDRALQVYDSIRVLSRVEVCEKDVMRFRIDQESFLLVDGVCRDSLRYRRPELVIGEHGMALVQRFYSALVSDILSSLSTSFMGAGESGDGQDSAYTLTVAPAVLDHIIREALMGLSEMLIKPKLRVFNTSERKCNGLMSALSKTTGEIEQRMIEEDKLRSEAIRRAGYLVLSGGAGLGRAKQERPSQRLFTLDRLRVVLRSLSVDLTRLEFGTIVTNCFHYQAQVAHNKSEIAASTNALEFLKAEQRNKFERLVQERYADVDTAIKSLMERVEINKTKSVLETYKALNGSSHAININTITNNNTNTITNANGNGNTTDMESDYGADFNGSGIGNKGSGEDILDMPSRNNAIIAKLGSRISREEEKLLKTKSFFALRMNCLLSRQRSFGIRSDLALRGSLEGIKETAISGMTSYTDAKKQLGGAVDQLCMKESEFAIVREGCAISKKRSPAHLSKSSQPENERANKATMLRLQKSLDSKEAVVKALRDEYNSIVMRLENQRLLTERNEKTELDRVKDETKNRNAVETRLKTLESKYISILRDPKVFG